MRTEGQRDKWQQEEQVLCDSGKTFFVYSVSELLTQGSQQVMWDVVYRPAADGLE